MRGRIGMQPGANTRKGGRPQSDSDCQGKKRTGWKAAKHKWTSSCSPARVVPVLLTNRISHANDAFAQDLRAQAAAMAQSLDHRAADDALQMLARLAQADS